MKTLKLEQGSPEWLAARAKMLTASEAPAMMGASPNTSRAELLRAKYHGRQKEVSSFVQERVFDRGHRVEAQARQIAEGIVGEELYPSTVCDDDGRLGASLDGITLDGSTIWECKQWNEAKAETVQAGDIPACDLWQVVQQLLITGAARCLYMVTDGTEANCAWIWVEPERDDFAKLLAGWEQFEADLAAYVPDLEPQSVETVGARPESLPALRIEVEGRVLATNLQQYRDHALAVFEAINTDLQTDQDFADAESAVKWCKEVEDRLAAAKSAALAQTADIDELFRAIDDISESARQKRLSLDKLVKARKEARRAEIQQQAVDALNEHYRTIQAGLTHGVTLAASFTFRAAVGEAMKGKRTIQSLMDAAHQALTDAKLQANAEADRVRANLAAFPDLAGEFEHLFPDLPTLAHKAPEDFAAAVKLRISEHQQRLAIKAEAERKAQEAADQRTKEIEQRAATPGPAQLEAPPPPPPSETTEPASEDRDALDVCDTPGKEFVLTARFLVVAPVKADRSKLAVALANRLRAAGFATLQSVD